MTDIRDEPWPLSEKIAATIIVSGFCIYWIGVLLMPAIMTGIVAALFHKNGLPAADGAVFGFVVGTLFCLLWPFVAAIALSIWIFMGILG